MTQTKLVFLDLDGVINSLEYNVGMENIERDRRFRLDDYDPVKVGLIRFIYKMTSAKIVISSSWRIGKSPDWFIGFFESVGWPSPPIIDCTTTATVKKDGIGRGDQVDHWLEQKHPGYRYDPNVNYVILDDDSDFYDWQPHIKTHFLTGITLKEVVKAIDMLGFGQSGSEEKLKGIRSHVDFVPKS